MMMRITSWIALVLLVVSLPTLWYQASEVYLKSRARDRYVVQRVDRSHATFHDEDITVMDGYLEIGEWRYERWPQSDVALLQLHDKDTGETLLVIAERKGDILEKKSWRYRLLGIKEDGTRTDEEFDFEQRGEQLHWGVIARYVSPQPIGFSNDSLQYLPGLLYPVVFPWLTTAIGIAILLFVGFRRSRDTAVHS